MAEETIEKLGILKESFNTFQSQGDVIDQGTSLLYRLASVLQHENLSSITKSN
ncbi:MAG: hypothetical protein QNJ31_02980 [Candidatus Caenarcaniphilales bacterium]|nr:hypothetical protein [Candidatus Caenarcaniphilales bacterium]